MALTLASVLALAVILGSSVSMTTGWLLVAGTGWLLAAGHQWGPLVVFSTVAVAVYVISLRWAWVRCWLCGGRFRIPGLGMFAVAYRRGCRSRWCDNGHRLRWGVRFFQRRRARRLMGG
jgi:hypothetical protein